MARREDIAELYQSLALVIRRSRELGAGLHPSLSVVQYALLTQVQAQPACRATDLAATFGLDKSTVSRQVDGLVATGRLRRCPERPGLRGQVLELTALGQREMDEVADSIRGALAQWLAGWADEDVAVLARLLARFNLDTAAAEPGD